MDDSIVEKNLKKVFPNVSRETCIDLEKYIDLIIQENNVINLISRANVNREYILKRHIIDSMQIIDFNLRASKNILHSISLNDCVLLSDSLIDDVLIDMGFKENIISADDLARVDVYNLTSLVQQDSPIKPINEYSFIVNN